MPAPSEILILLLLMAAVSFGITAFAVDAGTEFGYTVNVSELDHSADIISEINKTKNAFNVQITNVRILDLGIGALTGTVQFLTSVATTLYSINDTLVFGVLSYLDIPITMVLIFWAIVTVIILFSIYSRISGKRT